MSSIVESLVKQVKALPPPLQKQFRELLDAPSVDPPIEGDEEAFKRHLLSIGLISEIRRPTQTAAPPRRRVAIEGKPLSETVIEERR